MVLWRNRRVCDPQGPRVTFETTFSDSRRMPPSIFWLPKAYDFNYRESTAQTRTVRSRACRQLCLCAGGGGFPKAKSVSPKAAAAITCTTESCKARSDLVEWRSRMLSQRRTQLQSHSRQILDCPIRLKMTCLLKCSRVAAWPDWSMQGRSGFLKPSNDVGCRPSDLLHRSRSGQQAGFKWTQCMQLR